ncbi:MAG: PKD domain-containing protein, partial [Thermoplasmata archaeon]|nr:PKD domain-containing protein [Thermoplasmata archaeon]
MSGGMVSESFWDRESSGLDSSHGGKGRTTAEMRNRSTFSDAGWDFDNIWLIIENVTYPLLQWQDSGIPAAHAGLDITVDEDTDVILNGTGSSDDIGIVNYVWTFNDGYLTTLYGARITYMFEDPGVFVVTLNVTDGAGNWDTDELTVTVRDVTPPIADAGPDQYVDQGTLVTFNGSGSEDNVAVVNFTWTLQADVPVILHSESPTYRFDTPGMYNVTLNVTDAAGNWATETMIVTVTDVTPPIAEAGPDLTVDEDTLVSFDGSLSSDNVGIVNWTWSFVDSESITLWGVQPTHRFEAPRTFVVTLQVSDAEGNVAIDIVTIIVTDVNNPPVIVSDVSESLDALEDEIFTLDLSAEDMDGDVLTWSDNTDLFNIDPATGAISFVPVQDDVGIHDITITVDDGNGGTDVLTFELEVIEVNDPPEIASDQPPSVEVFEDLAYNFYILGTDEEDRFVTWSDDTDLFDISPKWGTMTFTPSQSEV